MLCVVDSHTPNFEQARTDIDLVCGGDSLTGWNNEGPVAYWPYPTDPQFLQEHCGSLGLKIAIYAATRLRVSRGDDFVRRKLVR
jgi:hypothetical protein